MLTQAAGAAQAFRSWFSMTTYEVSDLKPLDINPCEQYYEQVVRCLVRGDIKSVTGKVISVSDRYIILKHLDGRTTTIRTDDLSLITIVAGRS
jgi:small-conductance mechanosensitive channel